MGKHANLSSETDEIRPTMFLLQRISNQTSVMIKTNIKAHTKTRLTLQRHTPAYGRVSTLTKLPVILKNRVLR